MVPAAEMVMEMVGSSKGSRNGNGHGFDIGTGNGNWNGKVGGQVARHRRHTEQRRAWPDAATISRTQWRHTHVHTFGAKSQQKAHRHHDPATQNTRPRTGTAEEGSTSAIKLALVSALAARSSSSRTRASSVLSTATLPSSLPPSPATPAPPPPPLREPTRSIALPCSVAVPPAPATLLAEAGVRGELAGRAREDRRGAEDVKRPTLSRSSAEASSCRARSI